MIIVLYFTLLNHVQYLIFNWIFPSDYEVTVDRVKRVGL